MPYRCDFTIGVRETQDFYISLTLKHWWKGLLGFGGVGALAAVMYMMRTALPMPLRAALTVGAALAAAGMAALVLVVSTRQKVKEQIRRSGRESYIQETEINGFGVHVTVGKKKARLAFENLLRGLFRFIQNFCLYKADIFSPYSIKYVECRRNTHFRH